jgi:hypothetical protein
MSSAEQTALALYRLKLEAEAEAAWMEAHGPRDSSDTDVTPASKRQFVPWADWKGDIPMGMRAIYLSHGVELRTWDDVEPAVSPLALVRAAAAGR